MYRTCLAALFVTVTAVATASAEDPLRPFQRLPKDGTWATYSFGGTEVGNKESGTATYRMVGTTTEDGQKCRWFELQGSEYGQKASILKILVRAKDFAAGAKKTPKVLRGWKKEGDKAVAKLDDKEKSAIELMVLGVYENAKTVKLEKVIDYQKGQLKIGTATQGKQTAQLPEAEDGVMADFTLTIWIHKNSPFGTAASNILVQTGETTVFESTSTLQDHGTGAKTALPDHN